MKSQVLHTVRCYISGEAAGEIWHWSLLWVKGLKTQMPELYTLWKPYPIQRHIPVPPSPTHPPDSVPHWSSWLYSAPPGCQFCNSWNTLHANFAAFFTWKRYDCPIKPRVTTTVSTQRRHTRSIRHEEYSRLVREFTDTTNVVLWSLDFPNAFLRGWINQNFIKHSIDASLAFANTRSDWNTWDCSKSACPEFVVQAN